jgi:hypothetical protein
LQFSGSIDDISLLITQPGWGGGEVQVIKLIGKLSLRKKGQQKKLD